MKYYEESKIIKELANRMGEYAEVDDFNPYSYAGHDYLVLRWLRDQVRLQHPTTWLDFVSFVSGPMYEYTTGDYVKAAVLAIGIIDTSKE